MSDTVQITKSGAVAVITIYNPPVNALSPGVPESIAQAISEVEADPSLHAAVIIGGGKTFVAGADIKEFGKIVSGDKPRGEGLRPLLGRIENCRKPIVMAIHGSAFGGGLELAMAGHYRVAAPDAQVGQPEVKLGIIPGAGGTQRLPRLAGVAKAVEMCAQGNPVKASEALKFGIVDCIIEGDLLSGAVDFAREVTGKLPSRARDRDHKLATPAENQPIFASARELAHRKQRGMMAPPAAIDAVEAATRLPFDEGIRFEQEQFMKCLFSEQSKALIRVFFGEREVGKIPDVPKDTPVLPVKRAAVVGAGTMGGGIAMVFANAAIPVLLKEVDQAALELGMSKIRNNYANSMKTGRFTPDYVEERVRLITPTLVYEGIGDADIVIEAVFESMALKKEVFADLDRICKPAAILASNTSSLDIDEIASATSRPASVIGTHFFSPANVMRLLEIVRGQATSKEIIATSMQLAKRLGKIAVLVGNCRGFVGNRMFNPYRREAQFLVEEGANVEAVDKVLYDFGMAMGPLATGDLAGLDVGWRIRKEYRHLQPAGVREPIAEDRLCELGRYGQKTGAGWYSYGENRRAVPDAEVNRLVRQLASEAGIPQRDISTEEILDRCLYALVNEGARVLEEGIALRAIDIDTIYINGYGFPAYRGGPMWYADTVGLTKVHDRIRAFHERHGAWWEPAPLLAELAKTGRTFGGLGHTQLAME